MRALDSFSSAVHRYLLGSTRHWIGLLNGVRSVRGHRETTVIVVGSAGTFGETIQVPMGVSGVQAVPKTLHSHGLMTPFEYFATLAGFGVGHA